MLSQKKSYSLFQKLVLDVLKIIKLRGLDELTVFSDSVITSVLLDLGVIQLVPGSRIQQFAETDLKNSTRGLQNNRNLIK